MARLILLNIATQALPALFKQIPVAQPGHPFRSGWILYFKFIVSFRSPRIENDMLICPAGPRSGHNYTAGLIPCTLTIGHISWSTTGETGLFAQPGYLHPGAFANPVAAGGRGHGNFPDREKPDQTGPGPCRRNNYGLTVFIFSGFVLFIILYAIGIP